MKDPFDNPTPWKPYHYLKPKRDITYLKTRKSTHRILSWWYKVGRKEYLLLND